MHVNTRIALCCALIVGISTTTQADTLIGKVVGVADGDTITVLDGQQTQHKIRLMGIDCPEKAQPFGQNAKQSLSDLVFGRSVNVEWQKLDRYERIVGKVMVNGQDANLEQVRKGLAWHYKKYEREQEPLDRATYSQAEIEARMSNRGLWSDPSPIPPWDWRKSKKN
jgi:endonuclease YncB( thermonuclease family)